MHPAAGPAQGLHQGGPGAGGRQPAPAVRGQAEVPVSQFYTLREGRGRVGHDIDACPEAFGELGQPAAVR